MLSLLALFLSPLYAQAPAHAGPTSTWIVETYKQWDEGEASAAFVTSQGEVKPGWQSKRIDLEVDGVWATLRAADGSILLGTDDDAAIYRIDSRAGSDQPKRLVAIPDAVAVVSLAQGADGTVYAGTMPGGQVWTIDVANAKAKKLAELDKVETVWALLAAPQGKMLYAGTGPNGALFAIDTHTGAAKSVFTSDDKRIQALAATGDGAIWFGTSDKALVFRHDPARGTTRAVADFSGNEITAIAAAPVGVIVAANDFDEPSTSDIKTKAVVDKAKKKPDTGESPDMPSTDSKPGADKPPSTDSEPARKRARKGKGALFRVYGDGRLEQLHALTATYFTSIAVTESGTIFAGAGDKGRIYLVDTDDSVSTAFDVSERIISTLLYSSESGLSFTTSDSAALYRTTGSASKATYESEVFDTKAPSRFGKLVWHGDGDLRIETRSGNTAKPGKGWSEFAAPKNPGPSGGGSRAGRVTSPSGRYIQFRVSFAGKSDEVLRKTKLYYLPHNKPTRITDVTIEPIDSTGGVTLKDGAADPRSPVMKVKWSVDNPDDDKTRYQLEVRREGEALWRPIETGKKPLTGKSYDWNTETFPDGYYRLRVAASDDRTNSPDRALTTFKTTGLFLIDNEKPRIDGLSVAYPNVSARALDTMSAIAEMAYSIDDGEWIVGATQDGIFDDQAELMRITLPSDLGAGVHTLAIRVADEAGNIGATTATFRVK